jgi:outer membrane protein assembly factor BamB
MTRVTAPTKDRLFIAAVLTFAVTHVPSLFAADWPQFRGISRDGKSAETGLMQKWPEGGPKLLWNVTDVGSGFAHVTVADGLVYVTGMADRKGTLRAYTTDGNLRWEAGYGDEWYVSHPGARSIPTVHEGLVYVASGVGNVYCFDAGTGKEVWSVKLFKQYEAPQVKWGYAESLLIDGDRVFCTPCGKRAAMVALDRKTGKAVWASPDVGQKSSFCSPILVVHKGIRMIVTLLDSSVIAFSPDDGAVLWQHPYRNSNGNHCVSPIYHEGLLYVTSGYSKGAIGLEFADDGRSVKQLWTEPRQDPVHGQAVLVDGYVYAASHRSINGRWSCLELKTGKLTWEDACVGKGGSVIYADGMLYCYSEDGNMGLVRPNPEKCEIVSQFKVPLGDGPHWAHPVIADGRLYLRHGNAVMCYDAAKPKAEQPASPP